MRPWLFVLLFLIAPLAARAIEVNQVDDFQSGETANWEKDFFDASGTQNLPGGPAGVADRYLHVTSNADPEDETAGRMQVFNFNQWAGNWQDADATALLLDLVNPSSTPLHIRVVLELGGTRFASTNPVTLDANEEWNTYLFGVREEDLTRVEGFASFANVIQNVTMMRIISAESPAGEGDLIEAALGVDNIVLLSGTVPVPPHELGADQVRTLTGMGNIDLAKLSGICAGSETQGSQD